MCGIAGIVESLAVDAAEARLRPMIGAVAHRGPEGTTLRVVSPVGMAVSRLGFVADGGAPMWQSASGRTVGVMNGEIYNYVALADELRSAGVALVGGGDIEVIVELLEREGLDGLSRVRGMFALALYDRFEARTLLIRDRFGEKPLYWFTHGAGELAFASELTALRRHPACPTELDAAAIASFLYLRAVPAPRTMMRGVHKVMPGHVVEHHAGVVRQRCWWRPPLSSAATQYRSLDEAIDGVERALERAVATQVAASQPELGVLLSGGVDSALVALMAARAGGGRVRTFTAGFADDAFDERAAAERVAAALGSQHETIRLDLGELGRVALDVLARIDEPLADPSLIPTAAVAALARRSVKGVLGGDGADELYLGYRMFEAVRLLTSVERWMTPSLRLRLRRWSRRPAGGRGDNLGARQAAQLLARSIGVEPALRFYDATAAFPPDELDELALPGFTARLAGHDVREAARQFAADGGARSPLVQAQLGMTAHFLRDVILTKTDRAAMLSSLEVRSPFLDLGVVEAAARVPQRFLMRRLRGKYVLRALAARHLPPATAWRRKQGFRMPTGALLRGPLAARLRELVRPESLARGGLFAPALPARLAREHLEGRADHAQALWPLFCLLHWLDEQRIS
jgi:asparagine synthase (glutamine-hydrolysing)